MVESATRLTLPDVITTAKRSFEAVLNEFDVTFSWSRSNVHSLTLEVWVFNKRMTHLCTIATEKAASNSRAELRRKLLSVNAPRKFVVESVPPPSPSPRSAADFLGNPLSVAVPISRDNKQRSDLLSSSSMVPPMSISTEESKPVDLNINPNPVPETTSDAPIFPPSAAASSETPKPTNPIDSRHTFHAKILHGAKVIVLDLPNGLMIDDDRVLIIPLNDPAKFLDMPKPQFEAIFEVEVAPIVQTPAPPDVPKITRRPVAPVVPAATVAAAAEVVAPPPPPPVTAAPPSASPNPNPTVTPPSRPVIAKRPTLPSGEAVSHEIRSVDGVSSQMARHMAAIDYAQRKQGKPWVAVRDTYELLDERDYKQVSARMPQVAKLGFATRHEALGKSIQYGLTDSGRALLARLHTWPWLRENMPLPKWANF